MVSLHLLVKIQDTIQATRFHFFRPSLDKITARDRLADEIDSYVRDEISLARQEMEHRAYDGLARELIDDIELIIAERDANPFADDMIVVDAIDRAVQDARKKLEEPSE